MIIKDLIKKGIPFAVGVNMVNFKLNHLEDCKNEYFVIVLKKDAMALFSKADYKPKKGKPEVYEYNLTDYEILEFKELVNEGKFVKVQHNKYGRIYELKGRSFRKEYLSSKN